MSLFGDIIKRGETGAVRSEDNTPDGLRILLKTGIVEFEYYKMLTKEEKKKGLEHGKLRNAIGTYDIDRVHDSGFTFAGGECIPKTQAGYDTYWDYEAKAPAGSGRDKGAWRVYHTSNFVRVVRVIPSEKLQAVLDQRATEKAAQKAKGYEAVNDPKDPSEPVEA